jgi:hypothetical protein
VAAYYELIPASIGGSGEPERVWGQGVTANFFSVADNSHGRLAAASPAVKRTHRKSCSELVPLAAPLQRRSGIIGKTVTLSATYSP